MRRFRRPVGITANPAVGVFPDLHRRRRNDHILTEVPEMFGAETLLMNRCENEEIFHQTVDLINDFKTISQPASPDHLREPRPRQQKARHLHPGRQIPLAAPRNLLAPVRGVLSYGESLRPSPTARTCWSPGKSTTWLAHTVLQPPCTDCPSPPAGETPLCLTRPHSKISATSQCQKKKN